jgi:hypothetical protein
MELPCSVPSPQGDSGEFRGIFLGKYLKIHSPEMYYVQCCMYQDVLSSFGVKRGAGLRTLHNLEVPGPGHTVLDQQGLVCDCWDHPKRIVDEGVMKVGLSLLS